MNERSLKILEYDKIINTLESLCGSALGKKYAASLLPMTDIDDIRAAQAETRDAFNRIIKKGSLYFNGLPDIGDSVNRLRVGSALGCAELLHISSVLTCTLRVKSYGDSEEYNDVLSEKFSFLTPLTNLNNEIKRCIAGEDELFDDASPALQKIRRDIVSTNAKIREQAGKIANSAEMRDKLRDNIVTMRNGRYCISVRSEYINQFDGMIHDRSSTGSTVFIEPQVIVKLNNDLAELYLKEKKEIERILKELSDYAAGYVEEIKNNVDILGKLDFIFAKACLADKMNGTEPEYNQNYYISIRRGRHPLIDKKKVVPIDVYVGGNFTMLIVTGPNTGGKTVTLKTVGLFTLMGQAGLHIPAGSGSKLSVFDDVFADIGDEQSIEQSLSTFSAHMTNIVKILKLATKKSLCLFDELGAGTDPTEGAALAQAVLTALHNKNIRTVATTHYAELKIYALTTPGISNASCEFDVETLSPTYRLLIGIPGKSNAFEISKKLGISDDIIEMAKSFIGTRDQSFEDVITDLDTKRQKQEKDSIKIQKSLEEAESLRQKYEEKNEKLESTRDRIIREANETARDIIAEAKEYADETIKKINKMTADLNVSELERERTAIRERMHENESKAGLKREKQKTNGDSKNVSFNVGDKVHILSLGIDATVVVAPDSKDVMTVQSGAMQMKVKKTEVNRISGPEKESTKKNTSRTSVSKAMTIHPEINLIGMRVDEAIPVLEKYLDDAYLAHLEKCTIVHGRGTGALKDAVHNYLRKYKYAAEYRLGQFGEGDNGVTIVKFK